jgi:hypothetical protein
MLSACLAPEPEIVIVNEPTRGLFKRCNMKKIQTVTGPVDSENLGFCQSHEHLCIWDGQSARCNPAL